MSILLYARKVPLREHKRRSDFKSAVKKTAEFIEIAESIEQEKAKKAVKLRQVAPQDQFLTFSIDSAISCEIQSRIFLTTYNGNSCPSLCIPRDVIQLHGSLGRGNDRLLQNHRLDDAEAAQVQRLHFSDQGLSF